MQKKHPTSHAVIDARSRYLAFGQGDARPLFLSFLASQKFDTYARLGVGHACGHNFSIGGVDHSESHLFCFVPSVRLLRLRKMSTTACGDKRKIGTKNRVMAEGYEAINIEASMPSSTSRTICNVSAFIQERNSRYIIQWTLMLSIISLILFVPLFWANISAATTDAGPPLLLSCSDTLVFLVCIGMCLFIMG